MRQPFAPAEIAYLDANNPHQIGNANTKSYREIADYLNRNFSHLNHGRRTSGSIKSYYREKAKERSETIRQVRIPGELSKKLSGEDLTRIIVRHGEEI